MTRTTVCATALAAMLAIVLCACTPPHLYKNDKLKEASIVTVDAKQRAILFGKIKSENAKERTIPQFCAEPSPDVFSVVAQALSAGGSLGRGSDPKTLELALTAAFSSSEQGATIPRTQTVNMLRELMYRTCERYLSGGISEIELPVQAARDQRLMVSILAIESLAGTVTPKPLVIGARAGGTSGADATSAVTRLDDAHKDMAAKKSTQDAKQKEFDELNTDKKDCNAIADAIAKKEEDKLSDALKAKKDKCVAAAKALADAKDAAAASAKYYEQLAKIATSEGIPVTTTTDVMTPVLAGGVDGVRTSDVASVAGAIQAIVLKHMDQDEILFMCLKTLDGNFASGDSKKQAIKDECSDYIRTGVQKAVEEKMGQYHQLIQQRLDPIIDFVWRYIAPRGVIEKARYDRARKMFGGNWPSCWDAAGTRDSYAQCLSSVPEDTREKVRTSASSLL